LNVQLVKEFVGLVTTSLSVKEHSNDSVVGHALVVHLLGAVLVDDVDKVHLQVVVLAFVGVFGWCMHMELSEGERPCCIKLISVEVVASASVELNGVRVVEKLLLLIVAVVVTLNFQILISTQDIRFSAGQVNGTLLYTSVTKRVPITPVGTFLVVVP